MNKPLTEAEQKAMKALHSPLGHLPCEDCDVCQPTTMVVTADGTKHRLCDGCEWQRKVGGETE